MSYRNVSEILRERGIHVCHTTVYRWVQEYSQVVYCFWKKRNRKVGDSWRMDETYIKIKGKWHYLYRTIDFSGLTLDIWLRKKRDRQAAYAFFKRLQSEGLFDSTSHRTSKYLNNIVEQDHRFINKGINFTSP